MCSYRKRDNRVELLITNLFSTLTFILVLKRLCFIQTRLFQNFEIPQMSRRFPGHNFSLLHVDNVKLNAKWNYTLRIYYGKICFKQTGKNKTRTRLFARYSRFYIVSFIHIDKANNPDPVPSKILDAIRYIQLNLQENLTVGYLARSANLHKDYFSKHFFR